MSLDPKEYFVVCVVALLCRDSNCRESPFSTVLIAIGSHYDSLVIQIYIHTIVYVESRIKRRHQSGSNYLFFLHQNISSVEGEVRKRYDR